MAKKAKKVEKVVSKSSGSPKVKNLREHIERLSDERRDCSIIWTVIQHDESYNREKIIALIKAKEYKTLLGEIS